MTEPWNDGGPVGVHRLQRDGSAGELVLGPLTLAGDLFLIMLNDATGKLRVQPQAAAGYQQETLEILFGAGGQ